MTLTVFTSPEFTLEDYPNTKRFDRYVANLLTVELDHRTVPSRRASRDELTRTHTAQYVDLALDGWSEEWVGRRPDATEMHERIAGASLAAAASVWRGDVKRAFIPAGGRTHAGADSSDRLCIFNDVVLAAEWLVRRGLRVAIIDFDGLYAPQTEELVKNNNDILLLSIHDDTPGSDHDIPESHIYNYTLQEYAGDGELIEALELGLQHVKEFLPDVILCVAGASGHAYDHLTTLEYTLDGLAEAAVRVARMADEYCGGRLIGYGGAGSLAEDFTPACWAAVSHAFMLPYLSTKAAHPSSFIREMMRLEIVR